MPDPTRAGLLRGSKATAGTTPVKFGPTGNPVRVKNSAIRKAKTRGGRLYEDGSVTGSGQLRGSKAAPNARAMERANPNASFKRPGARPPTPQPAAVAKTLPKPPPKAARAMPMAQSSGMRSMPMPQRGPGMDQPMERKNTQYNARPTPPPSKDLPRPPRGRPTRQ